MNRLSKVTISLLLATVCLSTATSAGTGTRTLFISDEQILTIGISLGRSTILNFPVKPNKVILGDDRAFALEYVENDLAISALRPGAATNLFVYMPGRRFGFNLTAVPRANSDVIFLRDAKDKNIHYEVKK